MASDPLMDAVCEAVLSATTSGPRGRSFVIGVAGGVAVGKTTFSHALVEALENHSGGVTTRIVSADGFLKPNARLISEGLLGRKGYPESYDTGAIARFRAALASGEPELTVPIYSHAAYDVVGQETFSRPSLLIVEGLLAFGFQPDLRLYLDADAALMEQWYVERFLAFERHRAPRLADRWAAVQRRKGGPADLARELWREINRPLLHDHVEPQRAAADLVIIKGRGHALIALHRPGDA